MPEETAVDCQHFRDLHERFMMQLPPREEVESDLYVQFVEHLNGCRDCTDWHYERMVVQRGASLADYPCVHIAYEVTKRCDDHPDPLDCPDILVVYTTWNGRYGLPVRDGGSGVSAISHCPWCGTPLGPDPASAIP